MIKLLKKSKFFIFFIVFINVSSSLIGLEQIIESQSSFEKNKDIIGQLYNEDGLLMYDSVMRLFDEIENGTLDDICTEEDWYNINHFLAFLARLGTMPDATEEEKAELEKDIQELLNLQEKNVIFENSSYKTDEYQILPAVYYGKGDIVFCKSWFKKQYKHTTKFVKKHKTAAIIGTGIVVGGIATFGIIALLTPTAAATATATAAVKSRAAKPNLHKKGKHSLEESSVTEHGLSSENSSSDMLDIATESFFENQISSYKNTMVENNLLSSQAKEQDLQEQERSISSFLAHEAISNIGKNIQSENYEELIAQSHGKIDSAFATNQAPLYIEENNIFSNSEKNFQEHFFYLQGQQALNAQYYDKAIDNFSKAIETNPNNHNIYLDRAYAYLQDGQFDQSLNDYHVYTEQKKCFSKSLDILKDSADFCIGARIGLDKGVVESGKQLLSFAANAIVHPAKTYSGFVEAIQMLSDLAKDNEWKSLSEIMVPEACELINEWEYISPKERGERSGYIIGKFGTDILLPEATIKAISQGIKGAKELVVIAKNLQKAEKIIVLEAFAETGGSAGAFKEILYSNRVIESAASTGKLVEGFSIKKLAEAGKVVDRAGLTKAGRALSKHGGRGGSIFPKPKGNPMQINKQGQEILERILNHPDKIIKIENSKRFGKIIDIEIPNKGGIRYNINGEFITFIEP